MSAVRERSWIAARLGVAAFCGVSAVYAFLASSAFAYQQFLKPRMFASLNLFADWQAVAAWACLALLAVCVWPDTRTAPTRRSAWLLLGAAGLATAWNAWHPVLPGLSSGAWSLVAGVAVLLPVISLAGLDHLHAWPLLRARPDPGALARPAARESRLLVTCVTSALFVTAVYAVRASIALTGVFEPDLTTSGLATGLWWSLLDHLAIACGAFLLLTLIILTLAASRLAEYLALTAVVAAAVGVAFWHLAGGALGFSGAAGLAGTAAVSLAIAGTWGGLRLRRFAAAGLRSPTPIDIYFGSPLDDRANGGARAFIGVTLLAFGLAAAAGRLDWDFVVLKTGVLVVWFAAFGAFHRRVPRALQLRPAISVAIALVTVGGHVVLRRADHDTRAVDRYLVYNPSFRVAEAIVGEARPTTSFERYLKANTGLTDLQVKPVSIDFVPDLRPADRPLPHIFLFVIDSLRRDYLSPYNREVRFTPHLQQFAAENLAFSNAFTRYGGTGMSMPAIWAGSALAHKQYVDPFHPMNALEKLLDVNGYRKAYSFDHISTQLLKPSDTTIELDRGHPEMSFDFCRTVDEIHTRLDTLDPAAGPLFAHTRSLNLHVWEVRKSAAPEESYPGFYPQYAARVARIDGCFGRFVEGLKRRHLYDNSIIVFTADHGELLGEEGQWGHSYHLDPPVLQVPLLMHLPPQVPVGGVDLDGVSFTTDIAPTLYQALGYHPRPPGPLAGRSLLAPTEQNRSSIQDRAAAGQPVLPRGDAFGARRRERYVIPASYGAVYAVVSDNGRRVYIANAINNSERAYERAGAGRWTKVEVSDDIRLIGRVEIRRHVDEVARAYGLSSSQ
jgi:arylsulfatase A-like enzyme